MYDKMLYKKILGDTSKYQETRKVMHDPQCTFDL